MLMRNIFLLLYLAALNYVSYWALSPSHLNEIENDFEFNTESLIHGDVQKFNSQYYNFDDNLYEKFDSSNAMCTSLVSVIICKNVASFFSEFHGSTLDVVGICETRSNAALEPRYTLPTNQAFFLIPEIQKEAALCCIFEKI